MLRAGDFHVFHRFFLDLIGCSCDAQRKGGNPDVLRASDSVNSSQKAECAEDRSIREAREKLPTNSVDMPVDIFATRAQPDDPQAFFASAQRIVCHELCYGKMTARLTPPAHWRVCSQIRERAYSQM
jgi:hypothetical protein